MVQIHHRDNRWAVSACGFAIYFYMEDECSDVDVSMNTKNNNDKVLCYRWERCRDDAEVNGRQLERRR